MGAAHFSICSFGDPTGYADVSPRNVHERLHQQHATRRQRKHHRHRQERMHPSTYDGRKQPISTWRSEAVTSRKTKSEISDRNFAQLILSHATGCTSNVAPAGDENDIKQTADMTKTMGGKRDGFWWSILQCHIFCSTFLKSCTTQWMLPFPSQYCVRRRLCHDIIEFWGVQWCPAFLHRVSYVP